VWLPPLRAFNRRRRPRGACAGYPIAALVTGDRGGGPDRRPSPTPLPLKTSINIRYTRILLFIYTNIRYINIPLSTAVSRSPGSGGSDPILTMNENLSGGNPDAGDPNPLSPDGERGGGGSATTMTSQNGPFSGSIVVCDRGLVKRDTAVFTHLQWGLSQWLWYCGYVFLIYKTYRKKRF